MNFDEETEFVIEETNQEESQDSNKPKQLSIHEQKSVEEKNNMVICYFFFTIVWSIGGVLNKSSREKFDVYFRELLERNSEKEKDSRPKDLSFPRTLLIPKRDTIYDFIYLRKQYGSWNTWSSLLEPQIIPPNAKVFILLLLSVTIVT